MNQARRVRVGVIGAGSFGRNHLRVLGQIPDVEVAGISDTDAATAQAAADASSCAAFSSHRELIGRVDAAVIAAPTSAHASIGCDLLEAGIDVLVEKPIAASKEDGRLLVAAAERNSRILQIGHLERFNPAVEALEAMRLCPLFFEIHRLSIFTPRSLDVDVVLDLMIHDLEIILALTGAMPEEIRAAGIQILSNRVDIANVRLQFPSGCVANLTASRASTEQVRKLRLFAPHQYLSLDYKRQELLAITAGPDRQISFRPIPVEKDEPLRREVADFVECVQTRRRPRVSGTDALGALEVALDILDKIKAHAEVVARTLGS